MAKPVVRITAVQAVMALAALAVVGRAAQVQLVEGGKWSALADGRISEDTLPARRGTIYDRSGTPLAVTQEYYHVGIAPNEVTDRARLVRLASQQLAVPRAKLERFLASRRYVYLDGPYTALAVQPLRALKGVHLSAEYRRAYPGGAVASPVVGRLDPDREVGASGIERALDSLLRGQPGLATFLRDARGRRYESPSRREREPVAGHDVWLTIDRTLQEIAERSLDEAIEEHGADGGDVVFLDPRSGEVLAVASRREGGQSSASAFTDPFEPGSTAKIFTAAALLARERVGPAEAVSGEGGRWTMPLPNGRTRLITDTHEEEGRLTLARAVEVSSNIGMAKFSQRLTAAEQYETLRDFGFGTPTGVEFPGEDGGQLRRPDRWNPGYSGASHAMGYEFSVTAIQLAAAYGAIANDGLLVAPSLVREVRASDGTVVARHVPEPVRRVVSPEVARQLRAFLASAAGAAGTGSRGQLFNYEVIGKTGTARGMQRGRYVAGLYTASFAALFPAADPQVVIIVKVSNPRSGAYYGGLVAAPLTRRMLEQALAADQSGLDRSRLSLGRAEPLDSPPRRPAAGDLAPARPVVVPWPGAPPPTPRDSVLVPDVRGRAVRAAAYALHSRGLRVRAEGPGIVRASDPAPGAALPRGATVTLQLTP